MGVEKPLDLFQKLGVLDESFRFLLRLVFENVVLDLFIVQRDREHVVSSSLVGYVGRADELSDGVADHSCEILVVKSPQHVNGVVLNLAFVRGLTCPSSFS